MIVQVFRVDPLGMAATLGVTQNRDTLNLGLAIGRAVHVISLCRSAWHWNFIGLFFLLGTRVRHGNLRRINAYDFDFGRSSNSCRQLFNRHPRTKIGRLLRVGIDRYDAKSSACGSAVIAKSS